MQIIKGISDLMIQVQALENLEQNESEEAQVLRGYSGYELLGSEGQR